MCVCVSSISIVCLNIFPTKFFSFSVTKHPKVITILFIRF